jgi:hypothetical protein
MNKDITDIVWTVSNISTLAGKLDCSSDDGYFISWGVDDGYWLHLKFDNKMKPKIYIRDDIAPTDKMYGVIGYCTYHDIEISYSFDF